MSINDFEAAMTLKMLKGDRVDPPASEDGKFKLRRVGEMVHFPVHKFLILEDDGHEHDDEDEFVLAIGGSNISTVTRKDNTRLVPWKHGKVLTEIDFFEVLREGTLPLDHVNRHDTVIRVRYRGGRLVTVPRASIFAWEDEASRPVDFGASKWSLLKSHRSSDRALVFSPVIFNSGLLGVYISDPPAITPDLEAWVNRALDLKNGESVTINVPRNELFYLISAIGLLYNNRAQFDPETSTMNLPYRDIFPIVDTLLRYELERVEVEKVGGYDMSGVMGAICLTLESQQENGEPRVSLDSLIEDGDLCSTRTLQEMLPVPSERMLLRVGGRPVFPVHRFLIQEDPQYVQSADDIITIKVGAWMTNLVSSVRRGDGFTEAVGRLTAVDFFDDGEEHPWEDVLAEISVEYAGEGKTVKIEPAQIYAWCTPYHPGAVKMAGLKVVRQVDREGPTQRVVWYYDPSHRPCKRVKRSDVMYMPYHESTIQFVKGVASLSGNGTDFAQIDVPYEDLKYLAYPLRWSGDNQTFTILSDFIYEIVLMTNRHAAMEMVKELVDRIDEIMKQGTYDHEFSSGRGIIRFSFNDAMQALGKNEDEDEQSLLQEPQRPDCVVM